MVELALHHNEGPISARNIAKDQKMPLFYLGQIFNRLKNAHLVMTVRGPRGGYRLSRDPSRIKVKEILDILEDKNFLVACLAKKPSSHCGVAEACNTRNFWEGLRGSMEAFLGDYSLDKLVEMRKREKNWKTEEVTK